VITVGEACQKFDHIFHAARGMYLPFNARGRVGEILSNWPQKDVRLIGQLSNCFLEKINRKEAALKGRIGHILNFSTVAMDRVVRRKTSSF
jgi:hypothetical protein